MRESVRDTYSWRAIHLSWASQCHRIELAVEHEGTLGSDGVQWFFVDWQGELEIAVRGDIPRYWTSQRNAAHVPCVLQKNLFPGLIVPPGYPEMLFITTRRAMPHLRTLFGSYRYSLPQQTVGIEIDAIYRALLPARTIRRAALIWHANWLDRVADGIKAPLLRPRQCGDLLLASADLDLVAWRRPLARYSRKVLSRSDLPTRDATPIGMVAARLAHTHVVRLWGPGSQDNLRLEAMLLRGLARIT